MAYNNVEIKKFLGLYLQANSLTVPDGALERAMNIIIQDDDVIQKIKGFYEYYNPASLTANALFLYQSKLMAAFADRLSYFTDTGTYPNETGTKTDLSGATFAVTAPMVSRSVAQSGNLYMTTDNGVMKIDAYNGTIYKAGAPPGLDLRGVFDRANGILTGNSQVGYRIVFGRKDANDNLILGAPSDILILSNLAKQASYTSAGAGPYTVTVTSIDHQLATGMAISVNDATNPNADAVTATITVITVDTFSYSVPADPVSGTLYYETTRKPRLEFTVPRELTDVTQKWFFRVYRTSISVGASPLLPPSPESDFRKIDEQYLTAPHLSAGVVFYSDTINEILVTYAPELYTNPNSGEGELQANARPPKCDDVTLFQGYVFYAKCTTRHFINLNVVVPANLVSGDTVLIKVDATTRTYVARTGVGNALVNSESASFVLTTITVNYTAHNLVAGDTIYVSNVQGTGTLPGGTYTIATAAANSFTFTAAATPTTLTNLDFEGFTNGTNPIFQLDNTNGSVATQLSSTAKGLVKAVNRDASSLIYGNYTSGITDVPGQMRFTAQGFTGAINFAAAGGSTAGDAFSPVLPPSFVSGNQVFSQNENQRNAIYPSKFQEPEAAPAANALFVGSRNAAILRAIALRNSVIVLKEDGVFKVVGDNPRNFSATLLDNTVICVSANSAAAANNTVYFLASEGGSAATDSAVEIITRKIENVIEPITGRALISSETAGLGYDSNRTYRLSTIGPNASTKTVTYLYNFLNDTWTESDFLFKGGVVGPSDILYIIAADGRILKERKTQTKLDYSGQNYAVTVVSVASDKLSAVISLSTTPTVGDVLVKSNVINRIDTVTVSGSNYIVTFVAQCNLIAADTPILYKQFDSLVDFAPFHGGAIGLEKQFAQLQFHTRDNGVFKLLVSFQNTYFGGSEATEWKRYLVQSSGGWGEFPFGFEPWGQEEGINTPVATLPAPPIRLYIPQFASRATFLKTMFTHSQACDPINIQALALSVRAYAERVSK